MPLFVCCYSFNYMPLHILVFSQLPKWVMSTSVAFVVDYIRVLLTVKTWIFNFILGTFVNWVSRNEFNSLFGSCYYYWGTSLGGYAYVCCIRHRGNPYCG